MRPFQIIVLVVFGLLAIVGLFLFATFSGSGTEEPVGPVVIWGTLPQDAVESGITSLLVTNKEYDEIRYVEKSDASFEGELAEAIASGGGPDLLIITQEQILSQKNKLSPIPYASISERTYVSTYVPVNELYLSDESFFGMPLTVDPLVLYYNRAILASEGVALPPTTWEAVTALAEKLTQKQGDQSIQRSAIALGEYDNVMNARAVLSLLLLQSGSPITEETGTGMRSALEGLNAPATSAVNFYTQFANPVKTVYSWNRSLPSSQQAFLAGDLAFYVGFASERAFLESANPNLDFDMAAIPQPATLTSPKTYGLAYALATPRSSANPAGAFRTAIALSFAGPMQAIAEEAGMAPARRALLGEFPNRYAEVFYPEALIAAGWLSPAPSVTDAIFSAMIQNITTGRRDVSTALLMAHQALAAAL